MQYERVLEAHNVDLAALRKLSWKGVPAAVRAPVWQLLVGYVPSNADRRAPALARKRQEYLEQAESVEVADAERSSADLKMWNQISIDMPRTHPGIVLFQDSVVQELHRRLLFVWAVRHPATGYVQGINDLATPFFVVFLAHELQCSLEALFQRKTIADIDVDIRQRVEADTYWCVQPRLFVALLSLKSMRTGAFRDCWTAFKTTTHLRSRAFSAWCTSCATWWRASTGRSRSTSLPKSASSSSSRSAGSIGVHVCCVAVCARLSLRAPQSANARAAFAARRAHVGHVPLRRHCGRQRLCVVSRLRVRRLSLPLVAPVAATRLSGVPYVVRATP